MSKTISRSARAKRTSISVRLDTKALLNRIRSPGQSYDGIIRQLAEFRNEKKETSGKVAGM